MKPNFPTSSALTLVETLVTTVLIGFLGLIVFSLLNVGTILGAKNTATNTAHQQARMAVLQITKNLHSSVSPLSPFNSDPGDPTSFSGISFQLRAGDSLSPQERQCQVNSAVAGEKTITIALNGNPIPQLAALPANNPHLIIPGYDFDSVIQSVTGSDPVTLTFADALPDELSVTNPGTINVSCFTTDICSYEVINGALKFYRPKGFGPGIDLAKGINQPAYPFKTVNSGLGVTVKISTSDMSTNQYMKSHKVLSVSDLLTTTISVKAKPNSTP